MIFSDEIQEIDSSLKIYSSSEFRSLSDLSKTFINKHRTRLAIHLSTSSTLDTVGVGLLIRKTGYNDFHMFYTAAKLEFANVIIVIW